MPPAAEPSMGGLSFQRKQPVTMGVGWPLLLYRTIPIMRILYCRRAMLRTGTLRSVTRMNLRILLAGAAYPNG